MRIKMNKVSSPVITSYPGSTYLLTLLSPYEQANSWILSNFFQLGVCNKLTEAPYGYWFDFSFPNTTGCHLYSVASLCPLIEYQRLYKNFISTMSDNIINFIIKSIESDYCVNAVVNFNYISSTKYYLNERNLPHELFIYGFNLETKKLYCADFLLGENNKYTFGEISFSDYEMAFKQVLLKDDYMRGEIELTRFNRDHSEIDYSFNLSFFIKTIHDFLNNSNTFVNGLEMYKHTNNDWEYGIQIYFFLEKHIYKLMNNDQKTDIRPFHILYERSKLMLDRLLYMEQKKLIEDYIMIQGVFEKLKVKSRILLNLYIKFSLNPSHLIGFKITDSLRSISEIERDALHLLISKIIKV